MIFRRISKEETNYATHSMYRYPGQFVPQIPRFLIEKFSKKYDIVLDPFCGSGTTLVECNLLHRNAYGIDINPVARLVTRVKTRKIDISNEMLAKIKEIKNQSDDGIKDEMERFKYKYLFNEKNLMQILKIRKAIYEFPEEMKEFLLVCMLSIVKFCANIDEKKVRRVYKNKDVMDVYKIFEETVYKNLKKVKFLNTDVFIDVLECSAKKISLDDETIDLVVTSPPYLNALSYIKTHEIEMELINERIDENEYIGVDKWVNDENIEGNDFKKFTSIKIYFNDMEKAISEISRVLKSKKICCLVVDKDRKIRNIKFKLADELIKIAKNHNLLLEDKFYRYATKENKSEGERILIFRKI